MGDQISTRLRLVRRTRTGVFKERPKCQEKESSDQDNRLLQRDHQVQPAPGSAWAIPETTPSWLAPVQSDAVDANVCKNPYGGIVLRKREPKIQLAQLPISASLKIERKELVLIVRVHGWKWSGSRTRKRRYEHAGSYFMMFGPHISGVPWPSFCESKTPNFHARRWEWVMVWLNGSLTRLCYRDPHAHRFVVCQAICNRLASPSEEARGSRSLEREKT
ncbi:hypothetical protein B0H66DRAFT_266403 [Apodospora peruviana]|uniref:Uncharacterized protein n=1 Tax=Apodospora peruviana TaxID=516989 RepID=A0AAE0I6P9_9PEZI|nr:hypothetical protein B0H66DRAFT_266403 [Apodospora peruviana]